MKHKKHRSTDYAQLRLKLLLRFITIAVIASIIIFFLYKFVWYRRGGEWIVSVFQRICKIDYESACNLYQQLFRNNYYIIWIIAVITIFFVLLRVVLNWFTTYFDMVNQGINALLSDNEQIRLPSEMAATERTLNAVKAQLKQRTVEAQLAEQRKNDLVMYLAHDIRTPLTSVIGYLNLMSEAPDMPAQQKVRYMKITLDKTYRLEKMINEFFEITRYNFQQIHLNMEPIDLYYMLVQLSDELSPTLSANGNIVILDTDEDVTVWGDPDKLARVFNNILKNAAAYCYPNTKILISVEEKDGLTEVSFTNKGKTISKDKLSFIFERFYRLDEARTSNTGGTGLGLAIAKEIIALHGGTITAFSENDTITFTVALPAENPSC